MYLIALSISFWPLHRTIIFCRNVSYRARYYMVMFIWLLPFWTPFTSGLLILINSMEVMCFFIFVTFDFQWPQRKQWICIDNCAPKSMNKYWSRHWTWWQVDSRFLIPLPEIWSISSKRTELAGLVANLLQCEYISLIIVSESKVQTSLEAKFWSKKRNGDNRTHFSGSSGLID